MLVFADVERARSAEILSRAARFCGPSRESEARARADFRTAVAEGVLLERAMRIIAGRIIDASWPNAGNENDAMETTAMDKVS